MRYVMGMVMLLASATGYCQVMQQAPPFEVRIQIYQQMAYMTDRDFAMLTPDQQKQVMCDRIAEKIDIQLEYERHGSSGVYNLDALRHAGPEFCRSYLMSIH